ncbi:MAG TPA: hypothetical protein VFW87_11610, partial [Pirellulales bacterium]|nr:hypothetical protein [Pirellulales bacterium]
VVGGWGLVDRVDTARLRQFFMLGLWLGDSLGEDRTMQLIHVWQHWLAQQPQGINGFIAAVFAVALVWIAFERLSALPGRAR